MNCRATPTMRTRRFTLLTALAVLQVVSNAATGLDLPDLVERVKPSIVGVGIHSPLGAPQNTLRGTGFVIDDGLTIITNYHVVEIEADTTEKSHLVVFIGRGNKPTARPVELIASDRTHDLALLRLRGTPLPALSLSTEQVREGQAIALVGYPIGAILGLYPSTNAGIVSSISPIALPQATTQSLTADQIRRLREPFEVYQLDAIAYPGNSGSPVFDLRTGNVIGVVTSVLARQSKEGLLKDPSAITYAIPSRHIGALTSR
jgi:serine protease Do